MTGIDFSIDLPESTMTAKFVTCPRCGKSVEWTPASKFRPFCSERCKTRDLGAWANDEYRIGGGAPEEEDAQTEERPEPPAS
jgi:endogenous inhibitor of DNA gyrase (YacG/DUF329 family)